MVSKIEPDRYADTGFSVRDTAPEINERLFQKMMSLDAGERLRMGLDMMATAKMLVWASLPAGLPEKERRAAFYERFYGQPCPLTGCTRSRSETADFASRQSV